MTERAFEPTRLALLSDTTLPLVACRRALVRLDPASDTYRAGALRCADLERRTDARAAMVALERLERADDSVWIEVHALLELERFDEARALAAQLDPTFPRHEIAIARLAALTDLEAAVATLDQLAARLGADDPSPELVELRAELLWWRGAWLAQRGELDRAQRDMRALAALAERHGADTIAALARVRLGLYDAGQQLDLVKLGPAAALAQLTAMLTAGIECGRDVAGPVPDVVHALTVRYLRGDERVPTAFVQWLRLLVQQAIAADELELAWRFLLYGARIVHTAVDEEAAEPLAVELRQVADRLGATRVAALQAAEQARVAGAERHLGPRSLARPTPRPRRKRRGK